MVSLAEKMAANLDMSAFGKAEELQQAHKGMLPDFRGSQGRGRLSAQQE